MCFNGLGATVRNVRGEIGLLIALHKIRIENRRALGIGRRGGRSEVAPPPPNVLGEGFV